MRGIIPQEEKMEDEIAEQDYDHLQYLKHKSAIKKERPVTDTEIKQAKEWFRSHPTWTPPDVAVLI